MKTNLSSQISLHRVSPRYYRPENAFEKSVLTRLEKIPTDIYESVEEGANYIAREIAQTIREKQKAGRLYSTEPLLQASFLPIHVLILVMKC